MKTTMWIVDNSVSNIGDYPQLTEAAKLLIENELVAFPTETVYGLGANAQSDEAVEKIFMAKGRPGDNPLIVHIAEFEQLDTLVEGVPEHANKLIQAYWPGPLTVIFQKKQGAVSELVTAGLETVAVRMPDHPVALALLRQAGIPVAAPSANTSGRPSPTTANHVLDDLDGIIAGVVDSGETGVGVESTVVDCTGDTPIILRPGGVTKEEIEQIVIGVRIDPALTKGMGTPKSPGMKYTHYAPDAPVYLVKGDPESIQQIVEKKKRKGLKVGVLATEESASSYQADLVIPCGKRTDLKTVAQCLYDTLRAFNEVPLDIILSEVFPSEGVGLAIMNRLEKAAGHRWIE